MTNNLYLFLCLLLSKDNREILKNEQIIRFIYFMQLKKTRGKFLMQRLLPNLKIYTTNVILEYSYGTQYLIMITFIENMFSSIYEGLLFSFFNR